MALLVTDFIQLKLDQTLTLIPVLSAFYSIIISINNVAMYFSNENVTLVNFFQLHHHFSNTWHWPLRSGLRSCCSTIKIILHRIISVVWLTNFLSEIRRHTSPRWWAVPLFPEREKARGPALRREPRIDDRLSLPRALTKEKMPAEWLLSFKLGSLKILLALEITYKSDSSSVTFSVCARYSF